MSESKLTHYLSKEDSINSGISTVIKRENIHLISMDNQLDKEIIDSPEMQRVINTALKHSDIYYSDSSWLLQVVNDYECEYEMFDHEPKDPRWSIFNFDTPYSLSWYCGLHYCDSYSYFLAMYLSMIYPDKEFFVVYFNDHYIVINIDYSDLNNIKCNIYDLLAHTMIRGWFKSREKEEEEYRDILLSGKIELFSVDEHRDRLVNDKYGFTDEFYLVRKNEYEEV